MTKLPRISLLLTALALTACSTTKQIVNDMVNEKPDFKQLYLRGSFSWWEADEQYKVSSYQEDIFRVTVELVADGQPYDFKFADKEWSKGLSCGYLEKENDEVLVPGKVVNANCDTPVDNFIFIPESSGSYIFQIDFSGWTHPQVSIIKV